MGNRQGTARAKGAAHPVGLSGRTASKMQRAYREHTSRSKAAKK